MTNEATATQIRAATPDRSTWLTANAGSGKTRVLTDRVARLLLEGAEPQNILCLTYTKAAAGEMQNRLFKTLGGWAMLGDDDLRAALQDKGVDGPMGTDRLNEARRLFARAIETPGGLKIQTIHAFCASLLRRFPLEAGISPDFTEMDDRTGEQLRADVLQAMAEGDGLPSLRALADHLGGTGIESLATMVMHHADVLLRAPGRAELAKRLGADPDRSPAHMLATTLDGLGPLLERTRAAATQGSTNDVKLADALARVLPDPRPDEALFWALCDQFLTKAGKAPFTAKTGKVPTAATRKAHPGLGEELDELMADLEALRRDYLAVLSLDRTSALYDFAGTFIPRVRARMAARGLLGFDDLIARTRDLLADPQVADWVLWRLDGGIDHILVDEAQDTSPEQWQVIRALAQEMSSGRGRGDDRPRTLFVVGDRKQSIYSFQGADPDEFDNMQRHFHDWLAEADTPLAKETLAYSFRSAPAILSLVDRVFQGDNADGLERNVQHKAFRDQMPGRVDLWEPLEDEKPDREELDWTAPVDQMRPESARSRLAGMVADRIATMIDQDTIPCDLPGGAQGRRPVRAGDVLILVRGRKDGLFESLLRACKSRGLPVAGADRLRLGAEMAVRDLVALLSFLALPEDSLSLATALRSPLFGWSEKALYDLAQPREAGKTLWSALYHSRDRHPETVAMLEDLRARSDYLRPFDLLSRILTRHGGRERLLARLGPESEEGIDALLSQALIYEQAHVPGLTDFLVWLEAEDVEIKRQMDSSGDAIRIMTVHGSKGLEAPIVILPDCAARPARDRSPLLEDDGVLHWAPVKALRPDAITQLSDQAKAAEERESRRLLYVAMTRAEKWLIVAAAGKTGDGSDSWHAMVRGAMEPLATALPEADPDGLRLTTGDWLAPPLADAPPPAQDAVAEPIPGRAPSVAGPTRTLAPSDLGGAKALPEEGADPDQKAVAMARGSVLHQLLELLPEVPPPARPALAARITGDSPALRDLPEVAQRLLEAPELAPVFAPGTLAEVELTAPLAELGGRQMGGIIDRLLIDQNRVIAVDFKSNRLVPTTPDQVPEGILRQMGAYGAALAQIYPGRHIETAILWTQTGALMTLPPALTAAALDRAWPG